MKVLGIIAEYNPFHNGHQFHIQKAKEMTGADYVFGVMSGDFVQRGEPACIDKYMRTKMALMNDADLIFELPHYYALGNAEHFAMGAITLLDKLGVVDYVCFGSECGDVGTLREIAQVLLDEPHVYQTTLKAGLKEGLTYPAASAAALIEYFQDESINDTISQPNNILGIYYMKALLKRKSNIKPYTLIRHGNQYNDDILNKTNEHNPISGSDWILSSALSIRNTLNKSDKKDKSALSKLSSLSEISAHVPENIYPALLQSIGKSFPIVTNDFSAMLGYKLLNEITLDFMDYVDVSESLSDRIKNTYRHYDSFDGFCNLLKTKGFTHARVSRCLIHILLNMKNETLADYVRNDYITYTRLLGFRITSLPLLSAIKEHADIPMISKLADAKKILSAQALTMLEDDVFASHIYQLAVTEKFKTKFKNEYSRTIIKI